MDKTPEIELVLKEYMMLAQSLWNGTAPIAPNSLKDREIFDLLGFDQTQELNMLWKPDRALLLEQEYQDKRHQIAQYFDKTAEKARERLTSNDESLCFIRESVREGRESMQSHILERIGENLSGNVAEHWQKCLKNKKCHTQVCLLYTSPSPRD